MTLDRIRYKISCGIGHHLELAPMLDHALAAFLTALQCKAGIVCTPRVAPNGSWHMLIAHSHPRARNSLNCSEGASLLPRGPDRISLDAFWNRPPYAFSSPPLKAYIFPLPAFGALIIDAESTILAAEDLPRLGAIARQLAAACVNCTRFREISGQMDGARKSNGQRTREKSDLDQLFDHAQVGIILAENDGTILRINPEFQRIFGYTFEECIGKNIDDIVAADDERDKAARITRTVSEGKRLSFEARRRCKDGSIKNVAVMASPIILHGDQVAVYAFYRDVTVRRQMEAELLKAKKLEATGKLAGGIAHDFNNLLAIILGNIELALLDLPEKSPSEEPLAYAKLICRRAHDLTQKFITFSAGGQPVRKTVRLAGILREAAKEAFTNKAVKYHIDLPEDLWPVQIDAEQFKHALSAIMINAAEAMPEGGEVFISGNNLRTAQCRCNPLLDSIDACIRIVVQDSGVGVPADAMPQLFDPYYSTKKSANQTGLGMGLTVAHSIVIQHEGFIQIESEESKGTTVYIYLPVDQAQNAS